MSLVGPRPERPSFVNQFRETIPGLRPTARSAWRNDRLGASSRMARSTSLRKRIQYDLDYIERWSPALDLRILVMTVQHVLWGKISWNESKRPAKTMG